MTRIFVKFATIRKIRENLFGATGGAARGCAGPAGCTRRALELPATRKSKRRHHAANFFAFTIGTYDLLRRFKDNLFKFMLTLIAVVFIDRHLRRSFSK